MIVIKLCYQETTIHSTMTLLILGMKPGLFQSSLSVCLITRNTKICFLKPLPFSLNNRFPSISLLGNAGPGCRSANSPGDQPDVISVGATDSSSAVAAFSSHGPSAVNLRIKPEVSAPGVNIRSASHRGDELTAILSGTSMASKCDTFLRSGYSYRTAIFCSNIQKVC
jgi:hypothetical protein